MKTQVSPFQFIVLMVWLILGTGIVTLPSAFQTFTFYQDGWICAILMGVAPCGIALLAFLYTRTFGHDVSLYAALQQVNGIVRWVVGPWFVGWLFICACTIVREFSNFIEQNFLPYTPIYIECALIVIPMAYAVYTGFENIARVGVIVTVWVAVTFLLNYVLLATKMHVSYLRPVLAAGWQPVIRADIYPWAFSTELIVSLILIPSVGKARNLHRYILQAGACIIIMAVLLELATIMTLGPSGTYKSYPVFAAARLISVGPLIQRVEPLYVVIVIATILIKVSVFHHTLCQSSRELFRFKDGEERQLGISLSILVWAGSVFFFHNESELNHFILEVFPAYTFTLPVLVAFVIFVRVIQKGLRKRWLTT